MVEWNLSSSFPPGFQYKARHEDKVCRLLELLFWCWQESIPFLLLPKSISLLYLVRCFWLVLVSWVTLRCFIVCSVLITVLCLRLALLSWLFESQEENHDNLSSLVLLKWCCKTLCHHHLSKRKEANKASRRVFLLKFKAERTVRSSFAYLLFHCLESLKYR